MRSDPGRRSLLGACVGAPLLAAAVLAGRRVRASLIGVGALADGRVDVPVGGGFPRVLHGAAGESWTLSRPPRRQRRGRQKRRADTGAEHEPPAAIGRQYQATSTGERLLTVSGGNATVACGVPEMSKSWIFGVLPRNSGTNSSAAVAADGPIE